LLQTESIPDILIDGHITGEIAAHLKVHRSTVPLWIDQWNRYGKEGLLEGHRSGRPAALSGEDRERLCDILDSGPVENLLDHYGQPNSPRSIAR
jgi:transposase